MNISELVTTEIQKNSHFMDCTSKSRASIWWPAVRHSCVLELESVCPRNPSFPSKVRVGDPKHHLASNPVSELIGPRLLEAPAASLILSCHLGKMLLWSSRTNMVRSMFSIWQIWYLHLFFRLHSHGSCFCGCFMICVVYVSMREREHTQWANNYWKFFEKILAFTSPVNTSNCNSSCMCLCVVSCTLENILFNVILRALVHLLFLLYLAM